MEQVRETFATAYFAKRNFGRQSIRVYMAVFQPFDRNLEWEEACRDYIDGFFGMAAKSTSKEPRYIDELLEELIMTYAS